ncbi:hypothetical protein KR032_001968, partial [Drosophila birchii]
QPQYPSFSAAMNCLDQRSPYTQIGIGAVGGFLTGFVFLKASKMVAMAAGGTILAIELAIQANVIHLEFFECVREPGFDQAPRGQLRIAGQTHHPEASNLTSIEQLGEKARKACASSRRLFVAFVGGFLLGFGWA